MPVTEAPGEGDVKMVEIDGHRIGLFRVAGDLYALADRCPHRGAPLCSGRVTSPTEASGEDVVLGPRGSIVRCPWHKWEFEIASGRSLVDPRLRARRYAVRLDGEHVVVSLDHPDAG